MFITQLATLSQFYQKVRAIVSVLNNEQLRLITGETELREDLTTLRAAGIVHGTMVYSVVRTVGGSDPCIQMLQSCPDTTIYCVITPSKRACVQYRALVQHTEACKQMKYPACSGEFYFICVRKKDPGSEDRLEDTNVAIVSLLLGKQAFQLLARR